MHQEWPNCTPAQKSMDLSRDKEYFIERHLMDERISSLINGFYGASNFIELFYSLPEIAAPVNEIASRVAHANWQLKKTKDDQVDFDNADFNRLFTNPNPLNNMRQFVYQAVCYELLTGRNLFYFNMPDMLVTAQKFQRIINWHNLPSQSTMIDPNWSVDPYTATSVNDYVKEYRVPFLQSEKIITPDKVLPLIYHNLNIPTDIRFSKSPLCGAEKAIKNLIPVYEARGVIYIKRGALGFIVSRKSDTLGSVPLTPEEKQEAQNAYQTEFGLRGHKNQISLISAPVDFVKTSMSIQELEPFNETMADALAIYATLRVPRHLVPTKDQSTYANADTDLKSFYEDVIIPMAEKYAQAWTTYMGFDQVKRYIYPDFSHIGVLQENRKEEANVDQVEGNVFLQRFMAGICSLNEWIVTTEGEKGTLPLYDKKLFEMTPEELQTVKDILNIQTQSSGTAKSETSQTPEPPVIP